MLGTLVGSVANPGKPPLVYFGEREGVGRVICAQRHNQGDDVCGSSHLTFVMKGRLTFLSFTAVIICAQKQNQHNSVHTFYMFVFPHVSICAQFYDFML